MVRSQPFWMVSMATVEFFKFDRLGHVYCSRYTSPIPPALSSLPFLRLLLSPSPHQPSPHISVGSKSVGPFSCTNIVPVLGAVPLTADPSAAEPAPLSTPSQSGRHTGRNR